MSPSRFRSKPLAALLLSLGSGGALFALSLPASAAAAPPAADAPPPPPAPDTLAPPPGPGGDWQRPDGPHPRPGLHMGQHRPGAEGMPVLPLLRKLDLSPAQRDTVQQLMDKNREPHRALMQRRFELRRAFADLDPVAPDYRKKADQLADTAARLAQETLRFDARVTTELVAVVTPEQGKALQAELAQRRERLQARQQRHLQRPPPPAAPQS